MLSSRILKYALVTSATALSTIGAANVVGSDHQNFNPAMTNKDFVTVFSADTLGQGNYSLGLFYNYATNTLPYFDKDGENIDKEKTLNNSLSTVEIGGAYGIFSWWDIGISLPYLLHQSVDEDSNDFYGYFSELGILSFKVYNKFKVYEHKELKLGIVNTINVNTVQDNPYTGDSAFPAISLEGIASWEKGIWKLAANGGYKYRQPGEAISFANNAQPIEPFENQFTYSGAVGVKIPDTKLEINTEVYGTYSNENLSTVSPRNASVLEGLLGARYYLPHDLSVHAGVGSELRHSVSSSDFRAYAGIRWTPTNDKKTPVEEPEEIKETPKQAKPIKANVEVGKVKVKKSSPDATIVADGLLFDFNSANIKQKAASKQMDKLAKILTGPASIDKIVVEGHTCSMGDEAYNKFLSEERAENIAKVLKAKFNLSSAQVVPIGYGEARPVASNETKAGRKKNRRVVFKIFLSNDKKVSEK